MLWIPVVPGQVVSQPPSLSQKVAGSLADFVGINCPVPSSLGINLNVALGAGPDSVTVVTYPVHFVVSTTRPDIDPGLRSQLNACIQGAFAKAKEQWCPGRLLGPGPRSMTEEERAQRDLERRVCTC